MSSGGVHLLAGRSYSKSRSMSLPTSEVDVVAISMNFAVDFSRSACYSASLLVKHRAEEAFQC